MHILHRKKTSLGFTLLELLVVISIIGILIAISAAAFTTAQQKARNAKRQGDVNSISKSFEQYYAATSSNYAANCSTMASSLPGSSLPTDPKSGAAYPCVSNAVANTYCVCAQLEPSGNTNGNATNGSCAGLGTAGSYYCVVNQQ
ncbi:MAG: prepilin-type N-terminal cleavage/methylation domain-containing protein [Candidatus Pacebacteria bacterium]|nr:prepilin-type N-terminal cleavage/methylation domain-containing protein [Candidatus Paceibacterota bacterium]